MSDRLQNYIKNILLGFVLISIGFSLGKRSAQRGSENLLVQGSDPVVSEKKFDQGVQVIVTYLHATFRCVACNTIEVLAKNAVETRFQEALASGDVQWKSVNYQERDDLASRYEVVSACVVVSKNVDGNETDYRRLDEVWTLMKDPPAFEKYVCDAIDAFLPHGKEEV